MKIYAISDLHLSSDDSKPMNVFGGNWEGHFEKIKADWRKKVTEEDAVLIAGDISWAMKLSGALGDLKGLVPLPGKKIFIRGNHDYWWNGITKLRDSARTLPLSFCRRTPRGWGTLSSPARAGGPVPEARIIPNGTKSSISVRRSGSAWRSIARKSCGGRGIR